MTQTNQRILVVDDETPIRRYLRAALTAQGFTVYEASDGNEAIQAVLSHRPDMIILDLGLPDMDGIEVTRRLREWSQTPIIILSVREAENDKIAALDAGADDYLTKPFGTGELMARMRVAQRRQLTNADEPVFQIGALTMDVSRRVVALNEKEIALTPTEYDLLKALITHAGKVITHRQLLKLVWGEGYDDMHILRVNISNLRRKIEPDAARPTYLVTEAGVGYRLRVDS
ncbi:MAG: KDP operon transcriptional regulatory protein KdpE [Anaerolineales bacterium]|nr:response regulator transcription factor [Anaerolineae bacterium]MBL8105620.1 response regulator transcription factor [Anaerolineales bacterium]MBV6402102.1 KDP operon transcriptional regulatory protein KdpE [Anaerolineales bacterium]MCC7190638.1 response regulator transcription factor [Anaerolineales bacterium]